MQLPFELFASTGLGITHSSLDSVTLFPSRVINSGNTKIAMNATTGNTVVRDTQFTIEDDDVALTVGMLWSSRERIWRFTATSLLYLPNDWQKALKGQTGKSISLVEADGREVKYYSDTTPNVFICIEPDKHGKSILTINPDDTLQRFFPDTGIIERFDAAGRLNKRILPTGKTVAYEYSANGDITITLPSKRQLRLARDDSNPDLRKLLLVEQAASTICLINYIMDRGNPSFLKTSVPQPNDQPAYETFYNFQGNNNSSALKIVGTDQSLALLNFDKDSVITKYQEDVNSSANCRVWSFTLDRAQRCLTVFDYNNNQIKIYNDEYGRLSGLQLPTESTIKKYIFDNNSLRSITDVDGLSRSYDYHKETGLLEKVTDSNGKTITYDFNKTDPASILWGVKRSEVIRDNSKTSAHFYIYNNKRQLVYELSAEMRVTKYVYDKKDPFHLTEIIKVPTQFLSLPDKIIVWEEYLTEEVMDKWWGTLTAADKKRLQVTHFDYDKYGRQNAHLTYTSVDDNGKGLTTNIDTEFVYQSLDSLGRAIQQDVANKYDAVLPVCDSTIVRFDGLNREIIRQEGVTPSNPPLRSNSFIYDRNQKVIKHSDGLVELQAFDAGLLLTKESRIDSKDNDNTRTRQYERNSNGLLKIVTKEDNQKVYYWYDKSGRIQYKIPASGQLCEYIYDARGKLSCQKDYAITINEPTDPKLDLKSAIEKSMFTLCTYRIYDGEEQLRYEVTVKNVAEKSGASSLCGYLTEHQYAFGKRLRTIRHGDPLTNIQLDNLSYATLKSHVLAVENFDDDRQDRETRYFYDNDNLLIGEQVLTGFIENKPVGFTTRYERDGAGNVVHEVKYLNTASYSANIAEATPANTSALETWYWYDNAGRKIATLDPDNYLTTYTYYANGKLKSEIYYATALKLDATVRTWQNPPIISIPAFDMAKDKAIEYEYDALGRKIRIVNKQTKLEIKIEYDSADNEIARTLTDLTNGQTRKVQKEINVFGELTREASPRVCQQMSDSDDKQEWLTHKIHPKTGLRLSTIDALGNITLFYYDSNRRLTLKIAADGTVTKFQYNAFCVKPTQIYIYMNRMSLDTLRSLWQDANNDGFLNSRVSNSLPKTDANDRITVNEYEAEGLLTRKTEPNNAQHTYFYNGFAEIDTELQRMRHNQILTIQYSYDWRGNLTQKTKDPAGLQVTTTQQFDDPLNRPTQKIDELRNCTNIKYTGLRQQNFTNNTDSTNDTTISRVLCITQDAFMRKQLETDWTGANVTTHTYDDIGRTHTIISPENRKIIETTNAFDEIEHRTQNNRSTSFSYGVDGQLEHTYYSDQSEEIFGFNILGWQELHIATSGKETRFIYLANSVGHVDSTIDDFNGEKRTTVFTANAFGEDIEIISPDGLKKKIEFVSAGLTVRTTIDPDNLRLITTNQYNPYAGLRQIKQEQDKPDKPGQYQEDIGRDILNRETSRSVLCDAKSIALKSQAWDAAGHILMAKDGKGNVARKVYDKRGNLRFEIDAEGYAIEKVYNENNNIINLRRYNIPLTQEQLTQLSETSTPKDVSAMVVATSNDVYAQRTYDRDGLLRYEINFLETNNNKTTARITEWKYNESNECIQRIQYASLIVYPDDKLTDSEVPTVGQVEQLLLTDKFKNQSRNRVDDYARDNMGRRVIKRNAEGYITDKRYDKSGKVIARINYADNYSQLDFNSNPDCIRLLLQKNSANRANYYVYDIFGNLRFHIDAEGYVKEFNYDLANRLIATRCYYNKLSPTKLAELAENLSQVGRSSENLAAMREIVIALKDDKHDVWNGTRYDLAGRRVAEYEVYEIGTDYDKRFETVYILNALGLDEQRQDKCNNIWKYQYDGLKRLMREISPLVDITYVSQETVASKLVAQPPVKISIVTKMDYDEASNVSQITFGENNSDQRQILKRYDRNNRFIGTQVGTLDVPVQVDDPEQLVAKDKLPIKNDILTTTVILDFAGREIVNVDENAVPRYTIYDRFGRVRFLIDGDGFVTEFQYDTGFEHYDRMIQHAVAISQVEIKNHPRGYSISEAAVLVSQLDRTNDRTITFTYDKRGLKLSATKDQIITASVDVQGNVTSSLVSPQTSWQYNAFGEVVRENVVISNSVVAITLKLYDNNGNEILSISPKGYVTQQIFGMRSTNPQQNGCILLKRIEYAVAISGATKWNTADELIAIVQLTKSPKTRTYEYIYDQRLLLTSEIISSDEALYTSNFDENGEATVTAGKNFVTTSTYYDGERRPIVYVLNSGDKRYLQRNARGEVTSETEFPLVVDVSKATRNNPPVPQIAFIQHLVNAHQQVVGTIKYINPAVVMTDPKTGEIKPVNPPPSSAQDQITLLLTDRRGNVIVTQTPEGHLKYATYNAKNMIVRSYHWVTGYQLQNNAVAVGAHLRLNQQQYDNRQHVIMQSLVSDTSVAGAAVSDITDTRTYKQYNAFGDCVAEGPAPNVMQLYRRFNKAGNKWFTNEDHGIPTITYPNAAGSEVVMFRASESDLALYMDTPDTAKENLLDRDHGQTFYKVQRTVLERDLEGNISKQYTPWYRTKPDDVPENHQMSFTVKKDPSPNCRGTYITWQALDEKLLVTVFRLRRKGLRDWGEDTVKVIENISNDIRGVKISDQTPVLPADCYEYQLDFYFYDNDRQNIDDLPSYRTVGETMLDTGSYQNSSTLVWYMSDEKTLVLCGKTTNISGIELILNGQTLKRIAGTNQTDGKIIIDLSAEVSDDYEFRVVYDYDVLQENIVVGQTGEYSLSTYNPAFKFTGPGTLEAYANTLPPEIVKCVSGVVQATPTLEGGYNVKYSEHGNWPLYLNVTLALATPAAFAYGYDRSNSVYFLGHLVGNTGGWAYNGNINTLQNPMYTEWFYILRNSSNNQPHALIVTVNNRLYGTFQLQPWAGNTYRLNYNGHNFNFNANQIQASVISLSKSSASVSSVIGRLSVRTTKHSNVITAREIMVYNLSITNSEYGVYNAGGKTDGYQIPSLKEAIKYRWNTNISANHQLHVIHNGINAMVTDISTTPSLYPYGPGQEFPLRFQQRFPLYDNLGPLYYEITCEENDYILMSTNALPTSQPVNSTKYDFISYDSTVKYFQIVRQHVTYPNSHTLYFSPLPQGTVSINFEIFEKTILGGIINRQVVAALTRNKTGFSVLVTGLVPNLYQYRFQALDAGKKPLSLLNNGVKNQDADGWGYGSVLVKNGLPGNMVFVSKSQDEIFTAVRPSATAEYDRWHNRVSAVNRSGQRTTSEFNIFDQETSTTTPTVEVWNNQGKSASQSLTTISLYNANKHKVAEVAPNGGTKVRVVNNSGDTLCDADADKVWQKYTVDLMHRKTSITTASGNQTITQYQSSNGLRLETRTALDGSKEEFVYNEESRVIRRKDALEHYTHFDYDSMGHEIIRINPLRMRAGSIYFAQRQTYDARTGVRTILQDEDGNIQKWEIGSEGTTDGYFGNILIHTDFSGQKVTYKLNFNKQVISEIGNLDGVNKSRGFVDEAGHTPLARNIRYIYDESGYQVEIVDDGAQLTTKKRHDADDYNTLLYFVDGNNGRVYQATYTLYDELHRIIRIRDTRIELHHGYDANSNRRFARAYLYGDDPNQVQPKRESWYDYTPANRVLYRDCRLINSTIQLDRKQGMQLHYTNGEIDVQKVLDENGVEQVKSLTYNPRRLLTDITTTDSQTRRTTSTMHRDIDIAQRCWQITQVRSCRLFIRMVQPDPSEYLNYDQPTYVLVVVNAYRDLYYYPDTNSRIQIENLKEVEDGELVKELDRSYCKTADQFNLPENIGEKLKLERIITSYNQRANGVVSVDKTTYDNDNSILEQTHSEKGGETKSVRTMVPFGSGKPNTEDSTLTGAIEDSEKKKHPYVIKDNYTTSYYYADEVKVAKVTAERKSIDGDDIDYDKLPPAMSVTTTEDSNGNITGVQGFKGALKDTYRSFVVNTSNCIVFKQAGDGKRNYYFYAEKQPGKTVLMAYFGDIQDELKLRGMKRAQMLQARRESTYNPPVVNIDLNHQPLSTQYPPAMSSQYTVPRDMTYAQIAEELNYTGYGPAIAQANNADVYDVVKQNETISIPPLYFEIPETAWNGSLPAIEKIIGSLYPILPTPQISLKPKKVDWVEEFIEVAACVAIMAFAPEAFAALMGVTLNAVGTAAALATGLETATAFEAAIAYGAAAAVANSVNQGLAMSFGSQKSFNVKSLVTNVLTSAVSGGILQKLKAFDPSMVSMQQLSTANMSKNILTAEIIALSQQTVLLATGLEKRFDWKSLGTAAFNSAANNLLPKQLSDASSVIDTVGDDLITGRPINLHDVSATALGTMVGSYAGSFALNGLLRIQHDALQKEKQTSQHTLASIGQPSSPRAQSSRRQTSEDKVARPNNKQSIVSLRSSSPRNLDTLMDTLTDLNNLEIDADTQALADDYRKSGVVTKFILDHPMLTNFFTDKRTTKVLNFLGNNQYIDAFNAGAESGFNLDILHNNYSGRWDVQFVYSTAKAGALFASVGDLAETATSLLLRKGLFAASHLVGPLAQRSINLTQVPLQYAHYTQATISMSFADGTPIPVAVESVLRHGWDVATRGVPIAVLTPEGNYLYLNNRSLYTAMLGNLEALPTEVHAYNKPISEFFKRSPEYLSYRVPGDYTDLLTRRTLYAGELPTTWGEAATIRSMQQTRRGDVIANQINFPMHGRPELPLTYGSGSTAWEAYMSRLSQRQIFNGP